jgi:hypothetical protein
MGRTEMVFRKPGFFHEIFTVRVRDAIVSKLEELQARWDKSTQDLINDIYTGRSTDIMLGEKTFRMPDEQFVLVGAHFPGLVIEVASTQKAHDFPIIADDYITRSEANICTVLGLSIADGENPAKLHGWKPKYRKDPIHAGYESIYSEMVVSEVKNHTP